MTHLRRKIALGFTARTLILRGNAAQVQLRLNYLLLIIFLKCCRQVIVQTSGPRNHLNLFDWKRRWSNLRQSLIKLERFVVQSWTQGLLTTLNITFARRDRRRNLLTNGLHVTLRLAIHIAILDIWQFWFWAGFSGSTIYIYYHVAWFSSWVRIINQIRFACNVAHAGPRKLRRPQALCLHWFLWPYVEFLATLESGTIGFN